MPLKKSKSKSAFSSNVRADRFEKMTGEGLLDVKFYVASGEVVTEQVCREVNRLYEALERGESAELDFKDTWVGGTFRHCSRKD